MLGCVDPLSELLKLGIGDGCESGNLRHETECGQP